MDNGTPIYDISKTCDCLFVGILSKPDAASALVAEVLHQRFKQWASYLGVFAPENVSLDTRLKYSESISQLVLQFLQIASRNLDRIGKLDEVLKANNSAGEGLQRSVADEVDHAPESGASSPLAESLRALKTAIDGLYRLGVAIRQSSSPTLNQRISNFAQENDDVAIENMVFFRLKHKFFDKGQKESNSKSPLSLYRQLAMSISFRYFGLLYRKSRQEKIEKDRETATVQPQAEKKAPDQKPKENIPLRKPAQLREKGGPNELKKLAVANAGIKQQPKKSEGAPTTVNTKNVLQKYAATEKSFAAPKSVLSTHIKDAKYPDPPRVDPRTREARCSFCGRPIFEMDLKKKDWWHHHLDQDLKLYTCLSEACAEPPQLFIRFHEWSQHMDEHHSTNWVEEIHKPLGWCCDVEHDDLYFDDEDEYDLHVQETHPEYEAEKAELKEWGELQRERPPYTCPICNCVPDELAVIFPWLREGNFASPAATKTEAAARAQAESEEAARDKLLLHIGTHLKQLGLMSVAYFGDDADGNSMGSKRGSIPVDKDGKVLLVEDPPDYFDSQFKGYMVPTEPKPLDEDVVWSDVKNLDVENESTENDHDPILQRFRGHQLYSLGPRLLTVNVDGSFSLTSFAGDNIPSYAILSHMWGRDDQEVTFQDLINAVESSKTGYRKIRFCGEQAKRDGLRYFWVDSCCIDKSSSAELSEAINSMFGWYRNAAKCYVYLSDVSTSDSTQQTHSSQRPYESAFRQSRWFTRGWTLQELLAPLSVEFFSKEGKRLGDKKSLELEIHETTGIPVQALQGSPLSQFSVTERMSWAKKRETTREEDMAYSLLGVFDVSMPLIYGEGIESAFRRLQKQIPGFDAAATMVYKYYPIEGIKEGLGPGDQVPIRREVNEWSMSKDPIDQMQVNLFLLALRRFQAVSPDSRDSYFQIAGIHGMPYTSWDEPSVTTTEAHRKGYCVHANCLFPLWHRPYLLLYEQRIYEIMVNEVIPELPVDERRNDRFREAASTWRLPYWDWAKNPKMPDLLRYPKFRIEMVGITIDNPLYKFKMPNGKKMGAYGVGTLKSPDFDDPLEYGECIATSRCPAEDERAPTSKKWREGVVHHESITDFDYGKTAEMVYRLLTYPIDFVSFATTARNATPASASESKVTNDINIEFIHNNIHYWVGGNGGHMAQIPVATFDPVFWLHHCNLDRLFAIWQTLNPEKWFAVDKTRPFDQKVIEMGDIVTNKTPFRPFHKDQKGTVWTADDARDWFKLGYTYPELQRWTYGEDQKAKLFEDVNGMYGVSRKEALQMAVPGSEFSGMIEIKDNGVSSNDYAVSIKYSKFAMGGHPFNLEVYLRPEGETKNTFRAEDFVTNVYNFSQPAEQNGETVCSNCSELEEQDVQVTAYIPLTSYLIKKIKQQQLRDLEPVTVEKFLSGIYYRVTMTGNTVPEEKWKPNMNLKVDVSQTKMTYSYNSSATPEFDDPKKIPLLGIGGWHLEEEDEVKEPENAADFKNNLDKIVNSNGLERFFPPGNTYVKEVAEKVAALKNNPNNRLNSSSQLQGLAILALYQPVLYCDDSSSMQGEDRWRKQAELVKRITNITNRAVPDNKGVYLRFINRNTPDANNLNSDAVAQRLDFIPNGPTPIGTKLRERILNPLIYSVINAGKQLERPYLVMIITDGCPWNEPEDQLRTSILECSKFLEANGHRKNAVGFCISQIGTDEDAKEFLNSLDMDDQVLEVLYRTAELIDARYDELRKNEDELEAWLLTMLLSPVQFLNTP